LLSLFLKKQPKNVLLPNRNQQGTTLMIFKLAYNVLALGAVADFGVQNCQYTTKVDAR